MTTPLEGQRDSRGRIGVTAACAVGNRWSYVADPSRGIWSERTYATFIRAVLGVEAALRRHAPADPTCMTTEFPSIRHLCMQPPRELASPPPGRYADSETSIQHTPPFKKWGASSIESAALHIEVTFAKVMVRSWPRRRP